MDTEKHSETPQENLTNPLSTNVERKIMEKKSFILMLSLVSILFLYILKPFYSTIFWSCVIGIIFYPVHTFFQKKVENANIAALITLTLCALLCIAPAIFIIGSLTQKGTLVYQKIEEGEINPGEYIDRVKNGIPPVKRLLQKFQVDITSIKSQLSKIALVGGNHIAQNALKFGQNTLQFFANLVLVLYIAFFMLRDGPKLIALLIRALPLGDRREKLLFQKFAEVTRAIIKGTLVVACVQGALGGLIFWILDIPGAMLWGVTMGLFSLIPVVGAGIIWGPVAIYLLAIGHWVQGLVLAGFGAGVIGLMDNILRPILVGRDTKLPDFVILLSTLGGIVLFGINGFVIGPIVAALFVAFWQIFTLEFNPPENDSLTEISEESPITDVLSTNEEPADA